MPLPAAGLCFCPWTDLAATGESLRTNDGRCPSFRPATIPKYARIYLGDASDRDPYASPVFGDLAGLPPLLLQAASNELLLDDARRIHQSVQEGGGVSRLEIFDDLFHDWPILDGFLPEARQALAAGRGVPRRARVLRIAHARHLRRTSSVCASGSRAPPSAPGAGPRTSC